MDLHLPMTLDDVRAKLRQYLEDNATEWNFRGNGIGDEGTVALAVALRTNSTVQKVDLHGNAIGPEGAKALAEALQTNATLREMDLGGNAIGPEGAKALAEALQTNATLREVYLGSNGIGDEGTVALAVALRTNSTLQKVNLYYNAMGPEGAKALAEALRTNATLREVYLGSNGIGDEGTAALAVALRTNSTLQKVDLYYNKIGDDGARALRDALEHNAALQVIDLIRNGISNALLKEIAQLLARPRKTLQLAAQHGHTAIVDFPATQGPEGPQPLAAEFWREVAAGHADRVEYLLGAGGFDVDQTTTGGTTPLGVAAQHGHAAVGRLLLQAAASVDQADNSGRTPLAIASAEGHLEVATLLLSAQAQVDRADNAGLTPLHAAWQNSHLKMVLRLMSARTTIDHAAKDGSTPESIASQNGHVEVATAQSSTKFSGPAPPPTTPPPPPAPAPERRHNRWGDGLEAPAAGARVFFPTGWVPQRDVAHAIQVFGHDVKQLEHILSRGKQIASELQQMDIISVDAEHAAAVFAYTQDEPVPQLYSRCNEACRKAGAMAEKRIALFRDYLYHLTHALSVLPAFAGTTYRGIRTLMPPDSYALGKTVTWQAFSSTTQAASRTVPFLAQNGKQLQGSVFVLHIRTGRDIADFSAFPEEQEVLLNLNSVFQVTSRCQTLKEKLTAVPDLGGYDLSQLDVYVMREL